MGIGLGYQSGKKALAAVAPVRAICAAAGGTTLASDCTVDGVIILSEAVSAAAAGSQKASIIGMSASADMGNGFSVVANYSRKSDETVRETVDSATTVLVDADGDDSSVTVAHTAIGIAYSVGDITVGVNGGTSTTKTTEIRWDTTATAAVSTTSEEKANGIGAAVVYSLGTGVSFQVGAGSGKTGDDKSSSWSAGLAFSF